MYMDLTEIQTVVNNTFDSGKASIADRVVALRFAINSLERWVADLKEDEQRLLNHATKRILEEHRKTSE
jgi:hypothetical protein